jgi:hypothetical protein
MILATHKFCQTQCGRQWSHEKLEFGMLKQVGLALFSLNGGMLAWRAVTGWATWLALKEPHFSIFSNLGVVGVLEINYLGCTAGTWSVKTGDESREGGGENKSRPRQSKLIFSVISLCLEPFLPVRFVLAFAHYCAEYPQYFWTTGFSELYHELEYGRLFYRILWIFVELLLIHFYYLTLKLCVLELGPFISASRVMGSLQRLELRELEFFEIL